MGQVLTEYVRNRQFNDDKDCSCTATKCSGAFCDDQAY